MLLLFSRESGNASDCSWVGRKAGAPVSLRSSVQRHPATSIYSRSRVLFFLLDAENTHICRAGMTPTLVLFSIPVPFSYTPRSSRRCTPWKDLRVVFADLSVSEMACAPAQEGSFGVTVGQAGCRMCGASSRTSSGGGICECLGANRYMSRHARRASPHFCEKKETGRTRAAMLLESATETVDYLHSTAMHKTHGRLSSLVA